ncbi:MAG: hypothetical protein MUF04_06510, partial [Akkermansiaceae bacterium]|nr:hypothetical protein [Akkermansiaceae bacterium]
MKTIAASVLALGLATAVTASAGLTHRWSLNETGGVTSAGGIFEAVSGTSTAALFGDTAGVVGNPGAVAGDLAYLFKGTTANNGGNAVAIPLNNVLPATGSFSVFVTAKFATNYQGGARMLFSNNNNQAGRIDFAINGSAASPNNLTFFYGGTTNLSIAFTDSVASPVLFDGGWHEVGITRSGSTFQLYVDGVARGAPGTSSLAISTNTAYRIGRRNAFSGFFNNLITEVQVFDEARGTGLPIVLYDADGDQIADTWEISYFKAPGEDPVADLAAILARCTPANDEEGDGLNNLAEFNAGTHPANGDSDADGLGDGVETNTGVWDSALNTGTKPTKPDSDGDGLLDGQENNSGAYVSITDTGTNPNLADSDADTFNDYLEISRGSDPVALGSTPGAFAAGPLVELDAKLLAVGPLSSWANTGSLGRAFGADYDPAVTTLGGIQGVTFSGFEVMTGPVAPSNLTGAAPRTIRAWIFNPTTSSEETIISWGRRGGPNGTSCGLLHGTNATFGAVGNWGTPDMAWGPDAAAIAANVKLGAWTYVVYTYDGGGTNVGTVYANGVLANTEALGALATFAVDNTAAARPLPIRVAGWNNADGTLATDGQKGSLTIARLEIHDRVLANADLGFNDTDGDGMKDWYEDFYGLNKAVNDADADPDIDGLTNLQEQAAGTSPSLADSDDDGMPDGWEVANFGNQAADPGADADGDGLTNLEEYEAPRGLLITRDGEGAITGTTPFTGSSDPNAADSQADADDDSLPDGWELTFLSGLSSGATDDFDTDSFDNRTEFLAGSNPNNPLSTPTDTDGDGLADSWEKTHFTTITAQTGSGDPDGDGATNEMEETGASNPNDPASQPDNDADGLLDGNEMRYFGDLDQNDTTDFDGDTFTDLAEFTAGSNPLRAGNTPANVHSTVKVAVATSGGLDEYSVTDNVWTRVLPISSGNVDSVIFADGVFYATATADVVTIDPATGNRAVLATRNSGDALAAGWVSGTARDLCVGPDDKLYFGTSFGTGNGEGIFRLNRDGTGFERFIARTGGTAPDNWELYNCIGLAWKGNTLYAAARGAFDATNRPIYQFDAAGAFLGTLATTLQGPQGLLIDGDTLWVSGTNANRALVALDTTATPPVTPFATKTGLATNPDVETVLDEFHVINFGGAIMTAGVGTALTTVLASTGGNGSDLVQFDAATP